MTDFATTSDVVSALAAAGGSGAGCRANFYKPAGAASSAGIWYSAFTVGGVPVAGSIPSTWATCVASLQGAFNNMMVNASPATLRILWGSLTSSIAGQGVWFVDRLGHMGGLSGILTTAQTTGATGNTSAWAGTRCLANFSDVEWYLEWYTTTGGTAVTATIAVTYNDASTGSTTVSLPANVPASRMYPIQVPAGVTGKYISSVDSVTLSATTGTAGSFGVTALRRLACFSPLAANLPDTRDFASLGMPAVYDNACLCMIVWPSGTSVGNLVGTVAIGAK